MHKNRYWEEALYFKSKILKYINTIFQVYGNELILRIEELNLLSRRDNCITSSTAIGYCMEEFIVSKLMIFTEKNSKDEFKILRSNVHTQNSSFDCYSIKENTEFLINLKVDKGNNNAIAAIQQIYKDYVENNPNYKKHFMVVKIYYSIGDGKNGEQKILINGVDAFFLEEINFALGHKQDHRNWSKQFNANSGRIQISKADLKKRLDDKNISYETTKTFINEIYNNNKK